MAKHAKNCIVEVVSTKSKNRSRAEAVLDKATEELNMSRAEFWEAVGYPPAPEFNYGGLGFSGFMILFGGGSILALIIAATMLTQAFALIGFCVVVLAIVAWVSKTVDADVGVMRMINRLKRSHMW